jgi:hypothetical protein
MLESVLEIKYQVQVGDKLQMEHDCFIISGSQMEIFELAMSTPSGKILEITHY